MDLTALFINVTKVIYQLMNLKSSAALVIHECLRLSE